MHTLKKYLESEKNLAREEGLTDRRARAELVERSEARALLSGRSERVEVGGDGPGGPRGELMVRKWCGLCRV